MHYPSKNGALSTNAIFQRPLQLRLSSQVSVESYHHHRTSFPYPCPAPCQGRMFIGAFFGVESRSVETPSVAWRILSTKPLSTHTNSVHLLLLDQLGCIYKILAVVKDDSKSSKAGTSPEEHIGQCLSPCITWEEQPDKPFSSLSPISKQFYFRTNANISSSPSEICCKMKSQVFHRSFSVSLPLKISICHTVFGTHWTGTYGSQSRTLLAVMLANSRQKQKAKTFTTPNTDLDERKIHQNQVYACIWQFWTGFPPKIRQVFLWGFIQPTINLQVHQGASKFGDNKLSLNWLLHEF